MLLAAIPELVVDLSAWFGLFAACIGLLAALNKTIFAKFFKWMGRKIIVEPFEQWLEKTATGPMQAQVAGVSEQIENVDHYVRYHLGPNSTAPPLHTRIVKVESATDQLTKEDVYVRLVELEHKDPVSALKRVDNLARIEDLIDERINRALKHDS